MAIVVKTTNLHEFGPQTPACVETIDDETGDSLLDEVGSQICVETIADLAPFQMVVTGSSFQIGHRNTAGALTFVYDYVVDWGDGETDTITAYNQAELSHNFAGGAGTYTVSITGSCPCLWFGVSSPAASHRSKIDEISGWGHTGFIYMGSAFDSCYNMILTATDKPDFSQTVNINSMFENTPIVTGAEGWDFTGITEIYFLFRDCSLFNSDVSGWNLTGVTTMYGIFDSCVKFNNDISGWDTSAVTNMGYLFFFCDIFNHASIANLDVSACTNFQSMLSFAQALDVDISGWDIATTAGPVNMNSMFRSSDGFNQNIDAWDVSAVTDMGSMFSDCFLFNQDFPTWDTSNVTDMSYMFAATFGTSWGVFNGDISNFDTAKVTNMDRMLIHCNEFNHDISGWDVSLVAGMDFFMSNGNAFTTANYDLLLNAWSLLSVQAGNLPVFTATYTIATSQAARDILTGAPNNWTIADGGGI